MLRTAAHIVIVVIILSTLFVSACAERASAPAPIPLPAPAPAPSPVLSISEDVNFRFLISDDVNAIDDFEHVYVTISKIGVQRSGESGNWKEFTPNITEVDLKPLIGENTLEIWKGNLTPGEYSKVFIYISSINGTLTEALGGGEANVKLPSEKLHISKHFVIGESTITSFIFDVTVVKAGKSGQYILKPQVAQSSTDQELKKVKPKEEKAKKRGNPVPVKKVELEESETKDDETALEDNIWVLEKYGDTDNLIGILDDTEITIEFVSAKRTAKGFAGCNSYFVSYETDGNKLSMHKPIGVTAMYCTEPKGVIDQEQEYLKILQNAKTYKIEDEHLYIVGGDLFSRDKVLIFKLE